MKLALVPLALLFAGLATGPTLGAATLKVPGDHATISAAVAACANGDTIVISKGTYGPFVVSGKTGVTIRGKGKVVIDAAGHPIGVEAYQSPGAVIDGLRVVDAESGIVASHSDGVTIARCRVFDAAATAIVVVHCDDAVVRDNRVRDAQWSGVWASSGDGVFVRGNHVRGGFQGIGMTDVTGVFLENELRDVQEEAILVGPASPVSVLGNRIRGGRVGVRVVSGTASVTVAGNRVTKPKGEGVFVEAAGTHLIDNRVKRSILAGLRLSAAGAFVAGNVVRRGATVGVLVEAIDGTYVGNSARKCGQFDLESNVGMNGNFWFENDFATVAP